MCIETPVRLCDQCGKPFPVGAWPFCDDGSGKHGHEPSHGGLRIASIHTSERTVIYRNPRTGETRKPPRNDMPLPEVYARQGYVREELSTPQKIRDFEKETGSLHERSHYDPGSGAAERALEQPEPTLPKSEALTRRLVQAIS